MNHSSSERTYHVIAMSMPIVYTLEGDHDPDGLLYTLQPISVLLRWARERWRDEDKLLPRLHSKRQRISLVVDGLERLGLMITRLQGGSRQERQLLLAMLQREHFDADDLLLALDERQADRNPAHGCESSRLRSMRLNLSKQIEDVQFALRELNGSAGLSSWLEPEPREPGLDGLEDPAPLRLVSLSVQQRSQLRQYWQVQGELLDAAIEQWFQRCESDPLRSFERALFNLSSQSTIPQHWVKKLLLNDHQPSSDRGRPFDRFNPMKPIPAVRPLVLRCNLGESITIQFQNSLSERAVGFHLQGPGLSRIFRQADEPIDDLSQDQIPAWQHPPLGHGVRFADGGLIGDNEDSRVPPGGDAVHWYRYEATEQGVWPINDLADVRGNERGSNAHGLFGALLVEPANSRWFHPEDLREQGSGEPGEDFSAASNYPWCNFLDLDIYADGEDIHNPHHSDFVDFHADNIPRSFREFTVFIHDQPEVHSGLHTTGEHTVMPLSYRAEPMHNRLPHRMRAYVEASSHRPLPEGEGVDRSAFMWTLGEELDEQFWTARTSTGDWLERVAGEEQHHSSWLFGDPVTHVQRAYRGDPCRVRLVHAGVKETHIYHLHVHQWRAVAADTAQPSTTNPVDKGSQLLDSITISPQCAMTIDPLYGSGSRQHSVGDIIWHCHLYPHFHHGMWGLWRSYDRLIDGRRAYPDGSYCPPLNPLPGRRPPEPEWQCPGFPWFIDGVFPMKSPPPPLGDHLPFNGRRALLRMPRASALEWAAMPEPCRRGEQPGSQFLDLDQLARSWNAKVNLPPPRKLSYEIEVLSRPAQYNVDGWHDPRCHYYRLLKVDCSQWSDQLQGYELLESLTFDPQDDRNPSPLFPRANHGDIVEWRHHNNLSSFPADHFDHGQLPVECGLHVHLVKFDPLSADGSATGWNYLSGASCREAVGPDGPGELRTVSLHRWIVDEEFGPCFFHDHLLANFRQKHGLFAALIAEPFGAQWTCADDQSRHAWGEAEAVIVPPNRPGLPPYREACLAIADFIPLLDQHGEPLNPPSELSGDDDPGSMGVNYRSAPLTLRGPDPSQWFSSAVRSRPNFDGSRGDPDTPIIRTYPGERLRLRLIQGSHEEQHGFCIHGMRWHRDWGNPSSTLVNQQTLGISEAFTLDINPADASPYGTGDHLWHFCAIDDLWLGCWGLLRSLNHTPQNYSRFSPLPQLLTHQETAAVANHHLRASGSPVRTYVVVARRVEHRYSGDHLTDPWGLTYSVVAYPDADTINRDRSVAIDSESRSSADRAQRGLWPPIDPDWIPDTQAPLVLRVQRGEWLRLILVNDLLPPFDGDDEGLVDGLPRFGVEPSPARLPLDELDRFGLPTGRTVSPRVSIHASLLSYDVAAHDGSYVGHNPDGTVAPRPQGMDHGPGHGGLDGGGGAVVQRSGHHGGANWREYLWYADEHLAPDSCLQGPGSVCYLHDMADIRNHRHHGLIGAVIVESPDATPHAVVSEPTAPAGDAGLPIDAWTSLNAEIRGPHGQVVAYETCVFVQDGLRFFASGNPLLPIPDVNPGGDPEDSGLKAINYRSHPVFQGRVSSQSTTTFPLTSVPEGSTVWLRLIGANDKPRQYGFTVHGCRWPQAAYVPGSALVSSINGLSPCRVETLVFPLPYPGDYAIRAGNFLWAAEQGVWSMIRARPRT